MQPLKIYKKLLEIKKKVPYLQKDKAGFNYKYATPTAVLGTINPFMNELGLILLTKVVESKSYEIVITTKTGQKTEWKYDLRFIFTWVDVESGETLDIPFEASGVNGEDKGLGSALTYAERYFILKQFNIPTDSDDPDNFQDKYSPVDYKAALQSALTLTDLAAAWDAIPANERAKYTAVKDKRKVELQKPLEPETEFIPNPAKN